MEKNNSTISINIPNPLTIIERVKNSILAYALEMYNGPIRRRTSIFQKLLNSVKNPFKNFKFPRFNKKLLLKIVLPLLIILIFSAVLINLIRNLSGLQSVSNESVLSVSIPKPVAQENLNKSFKFPLKDEDGENAGTFDYVIENAELRKQIVVKGQRATSVEGRIFLILNLKITNNLDKAIQLNTRDYVRIVVNNNDAELLAADIHNDPVEVQAISTKYTRLGLAISEENAKNPITIQVGEIDGEKQTIEINFN